MKSYIFFLALWVIPCLLLGQQYSAHTLSENLIIGADEVVRRHGSAYLTSVGLINEIAGAICRD